MNLFAIPTLRFLGLTCLFLWGWTGGLAQISSFPHISSFEDEVGCVTGCGTVCPLIGTWRNQSGEDLDWLNDNNNTPTSNTGPTADHTFGNSQGYFIYLESSCDNQGYPNKRADLVSAYFDFSAVTDTVVLAFWYHMYGNTMGNLHLDVDTSQGQGPWWNDYIPSWTDDQNAWQQRWVSLGNLMGLDSVRFRFRGVTGSFAQSDMALDDIDFFIPQNNDLQVTAFPGMGSGCGVGQADSVRVTLFNWGTNVLLPGDAVELCYRLDGDSAVSEVFVLSDTLAPGEEIDLVFQTTLVLPGLGAYGLSAWSKETPLGSSHNQVKTIQLERLPVVDQFPYLADFEAGEMDWRSGGRASSWTWGTPNKPVISGAGAGFRAWTTGGEAGSYNNGEQSYVEGPCFDLTNVCRPRLQLQVAWEAESTWDGAVLLYSTNQGLTWTRVGSNGDPNNWYNSQDIAARPGSQPHGWTGTLSSGDGSGGWVLARHAVQNLAGRPEVRFRMAFASDRDIRLEGFAFDEFAVSNGVYLGPDQGLCAGDSLVLDADSVAGDNFLWSTGATGRSILVNAPGTYWVEVTNNSFCTTRDTVEVFAVSPGGNLSLGANQTVCGAGLLNAGNQAGNLYQWSDGSYGPVLEVTASGAYWVDAFNACGVLRSDTVQVTVLPLPSLDLGPDTLGCGELVLRADSGAVSYLWSTGAATDSLLVQSSGVYAVEATGSNGCTATDSIAVDISALPALDLGPDTLVCTGDSLCLTAHPDTSWSYLWSNGASGNEECILAGGFYAVTATNGDGCQASDTVIVSEPLAPLGSIVYDSSACPQIAFFGASVGGIGTGWAWDFGDGNVSGQQNPIHSYAADGAYPVSLVVSNACASDTVTVLVEVDCEVGVGEAQSARMDVYPNPSEGRLTVEADGLRARRVYWEVRDLTGRVVARGELGAVVERVAFPVELPHRAAGVYLLELQVGAEVLRKRLVVE